MKKLFSAILILSFLLSFFPVITGAEETPYTTIFSWNFTTGKKYTTTMVSGACATSVSWGDYRSGFMVFPIPENIVSDEWVITDSAMVFNNGRQSGQAPNVTIRLLDGDELYDIYNKHNRGTYTDSTATAMLSALCKSARSIGSFDTLSSNTSSRLYIGDTMKTAKSEGKSYIGFHLTCREEDGVLNAGIVNFVEPTLSVAPEIEEVINLDITISPQTLKEAETVTLAPTLSPFGASITSVVSDAPSIVSASFKDNRITLTGNKQGFATVTVIISYEDKTMDKAFSVSVVSADSYEVPASVTIFDTNSFAPIIMDNVYSDTRSYNRIKRAANDLRHDTALLTGVISASDIPMDDDLDKKLARLTDTAIPEIASSANAENAIIIGNIEESEIVQSLILSGKLTKASSIKGNWEGFVIEKVKSPLPGIENAIVIAGSDTRGTIYGIYHLSEMMGVSPWYWWSDVAIDTKSSYTFFDDIVTEGPDVQYRGIFINDEEHFVEWCEHHFPNDKAMDGTNVNGPNKYIYNHMFELLLRLGANTLWPAMHEYTTAFNYDLDIDSIPFNAKAAAEYGIVMSSSHCEIMLRNNVGEWEHWYNQNKSKYNIQGSNYSNAYDYTLNKEAILAYWKERLISNKDFESIFVLGIRGVHDGAPKYANLSGAGYGSGNDGIVNMMKDVITEQRKMIKEIYGSEDSVPQVFIPYKEMNTYYNHNNGDLAAWLPDDIIVMYAEDNQNYLRQTSTAAERARKGGLGIYYHNSYWGVPKSYLWLNSTSTTLMYEEMKKAYDTGAEKYWILNVGDLKPGELNMDFFMRMAWDVEKFDDTTIYSDFYKQQAMRDYNLSEDAAEIYAEAVREINALILTKKAEFFGYSVTQSTTVPAFPSANAFPFSVTENGDEGQILVDRWNSVVDTLSSIYDSLDEEYKNSFYEQIYHFALSYRNRNEEYVYYWKNNLYAQQGRYASTIAYADLSREAVSRIKSDQAYYGSLNDGKWSKILNYDHVIGYQPDQGALLVNDSKYTTASPSNGVGAVCEGQSLPTDNVTLTFNSLADNSRFIDVFGKNIFEEGYVIECDDFITLSKTSGNVYTEDRIIVSIDWEKLSDGVTDGKITVFNADTNGNKTDEVNSFNVKATKSDITLEENSYSEANGFVVIEAEHYTEAIPASDDSYWAALENLGQSGDSVKGFPDLAQKGNIYNPSSTAQLVYRIYFETEGTFTGTLHRLPTLNEGSENNEARSCQIAIGLKDETPTILSGNRNTSGSWGANVMRGYEPLTFSITIPEKGYYDLVVYKVDASIAFDRIVIETTASDSSHIGPNESPNSIVSAKETVIGSIPEFLKTITPTASIAPLGNLTVGVGTVNTIAVDASGDATITFETTDPSIAQVEYNSPTLTIYGLRPGTTDIVATVSKPDADNTRETFPLFVTNEALEGYKEVNGELVINAADALSNTDYAFITNVSSHSWSALNNAITVLPNKGTNWLNSSSIASAPCLSFVAEFTTAGKYYVSANLSCPDDASDSFHFGLNGSLVFSSNSQNNRPVTKAEEWFSHSTWTVTIPSAGKYTLNIWPREDGIVINQLYLSLTTREADGSTGNLKAAGSENENLKEQPLTDEEKIDLDIRFMDFGCDTQNVSSDITLPAVGLYSSKITWTKSSDEKALSLAGKVNTTADATVTLTATVSCGEAQKTYDFPLKVKYQFNAEYNVSDGNLTVTASSDERSFILALYKGNTLVSAQTFISKVTLPLPKDVTAAKVFYWKDYKTLSPLSPCKTLFTKA